MLPLREEAERLLLEGLRRNPGPWGEHSHYTAKSAERIAQNCQDLDPEKAYILGLLHDIGRREGVTYLAHIIDGYKFLMELGYDEPARICITHSFAIQDIEVYIGERDVTAEDYALLCALLEQYVYDDYDCLIQLCDSIALSTGIVDLETRMKDVERRYGYYPPHKRRKNYELKSYFEAKMGRKLYQCFQ